MATWQLRGYVSEDELRRRVASGALHREHRGVYAVGHPGCPPDAKRMAAVLACAPHAVLSFRALCHHLDLLRGEGPRLVDVTVSGRGRAGHPGIRLHRPHRLTRGEVTVVRGIPCTTVERLLVDMAATATPTELATLVHRAQVRNLLDTGHLAVQLDRRAKGIPQLRELIEPSGPDPREEFEKRFHRFVRAGPWPAYAPNVKLETPHGPLLLDAYWSEFGFGVELDSWAHHQDRDAFERDRQRVFAADAIGIDVKRVTWRMLVASSMLASLLDRRLLPQ
ncbi:MAG: hypothetical protein H0V81_16330 [Solirubrobacterales bacterium]|nr:hypothetical protein [Solirubrobacterales bacterium]